MIDKQELEKYSRTYSKERLLSFVYTDNDTFDDIILNYKKNMQISQAIYPELCTLEIILRNSINNLLKKIISPNWIEEEVKNNTFFESYDYQTLCKAYYDTKEECKNNSKEFTEGKIISNLTFGFWTNLCVKKYNSKIWNKSKYFNDVFVNYKFVYGAINNISNKLYFIRKFRNRVFHYEKIFKYPQKTLNLYNDICEILSYLPKDELHILKSTSTFLDTYNLLTKNVKTIKYQKT